MIMRLAFLPLVQLAHPLVQEQALDRSGPRSFVMGVRDLGNAIPYLRQNGDVSTAALGLRMLGGELLCHLRSLPVNNFHASLMPSATNQGGALSGRYTQAYRVPRRAMPWNSVSVNTLLPRRFLKDPKVRQ